MILNVAAYRFVALDDVDHLAGQIHRRADAGGLRGSVLLAPEGINLFLAGDASTLRDFLAGLREDSRFSELDCKFSWSRTQPFARLKVKCKQEIIAFRQADCSPLQASAPAVSPARLRDWLRQGCDDAGRPVVLLDTRNREEVAHGSFAGATTLPIDNFTDLPQAVQSLLPDWKAATVVGFCTGGIRCEKAALWLRNQGLPHVLQLQGGILGYFEQVGGEGYEGDCFVFDERIALDTSLRPIAEL